ncbi:MAG: ATP-binding cassette domain-containing protein [Gemmatimonadetes bacterium]|nr:ATP-binding cassette domain-containing protein [Gemmatimonadota bacterium]
MIELVSVRKRLGGRQVLDGVDLLVNEGETVVVMGPSGVGKSVVLRHIVGLMDPDEGDVIVDGISVPGANGDQIRGIRQRTAYVFQNSALFDSLSVRGNILMGLPPKWPVERPKECDLMVAEVLEHVNLEPDILGRLPAELSGGMQRRVAIARAVIGNRRYILYDEPTTGLDPINAGRITELISRISTDVKVTSVVVTHDIEAAFQLGDRIALLSRGKIRAEGTPQDLRTSPNAAVRQFLKQGT